MTRRRILPLETRILHCLLSVEQHQQLSLMAHRRHCSMAAVVRELIRQPKGGVSGWRPIETASQKEGALALLFHPGHGGRILVGELYPDCWRSNVDAQSLDGATHWMPLPLLPGDTP